MENIEEMKNACEDIKSLCEQHKSVTNELPFVDAVIENVEKYLWSIELYEKYGIVIDPNRYRNDGYCRLNEYMNLGWYGKKHKRIISFPDNGKQPENEYLLEISFPSGAYMFDQDYPEEIFNSFWKELKMYGPTYCDTTNNNLYFPMEKVGETICEFPKILNKYKKINQKDMNNRKIKRMEEEIRELKEEEPDE